MRLFEHICSAVFIHLQYVCCHFWYLSSARRDSGYKWWYFWAVSDGQACVNDKGRIVSPLPPSPISPFRLQGPVFAGGAAHTLWGHQKGGIYNWEEVQRQISGSYSHCTFSPPPTGIFSVTFSLALSRRNPGDSVTLNTTKWARLQHLRRFIAIYILSLETCDYWSPVLQ